MKISLKVPVFYITRDIERAVGIDLSTPNYYIISNYSQYGKLLAKKHSNIFLIKEKRILDTWELMEYGEVKTWINELNKRGTRDEGRGTKSTRSPFPVPRSSASILVFKNTSQIEKICEGNNWNLLNPPSKLVNKIEQKISQVRWADELKKYFPNYKIKECQGIDWNNQKMIIQFNQSHTGSGTILIKNKKQLDELKQKFPKRLARTAKYIKGPLFTNNNIIWNNQILVGNISYQITGLKPFTNVKFATIGNDWALPYKILSKKQIEKFYKIAKDVGGKMIKSKWKGIFGIDVVMDEITGKMYLVEINARQPASTTYESELQRRDCFVPRNYRQRRDYGAYPEGDERSSRNDKLMTTFQAHLASLLKLKYNNEKLIKITNGAQIIDRVNNKVTNNKKQLDNMINKLQVTNCKLQVIRYNNTKPNSDLLRIQSKNGIMNKHNKFNKTGLKIKKILEIRN